MNRTTHGSDLGSKGISSRVRVKTNHKLRNVVPPSCRNGCIIEHWQCQHCVSIMSISGVRLMHSRAEKHQNKLQTMVCFEKRN